MNAQRGGFAMGLVAGLLIGLALALAVALYITKAPVPFINKVPQRTPEQDSAETERNRSWDPNAQLAGKPVAHPGAAASGAVVAMPSPMPPAAVPAVPPGAVPAAKPARDPAAILSGGPVVPTAAADPFIYFVQAGAYTRSDDAEQQRARLAMLGQSAKISQREQAGRTVYRVRIGPFTTRDEAGGLQSRLQEQSVDAQIVRVERP